MIENVIGAGFSAHRMQNFLMAVRCEIPGYPARVIARPAFYNTTAMLESIKSSTFPALPFVTGPMPDGMRYNDWRQGPIQQRFSHNYRITCRAQTQRSQPAPAHPQPPAQAFATCPNPGGKLYSTGVSPISLFPPRNFGKGATTLTIPLIVWNDPGFLMQRMQNFLIAVPGKIPS